jgi:DNA-binding transcriptional LysR family regulator
MDLDLTGVSDFLVLLEVGHYGRAAARLHLSASALSKRIQRLEHQVGVALVVRDPRGTAGATAAGARFAQYAGPLLTAARAAREAALTAPSPAVVRLGVPGGFDHLPGQVLLAEVRRQLELHCPGVRLLCVALPLTAVHSSVLERSVDVVWGAFGESPSSLELVPAGEFFRVGVLPARHALADADSLCVADLIDLPLQSNPAIPADWMSPFFLGDVRPARQARLVEVHATNANDAFRQVVRGEAVTTGTPWLTARLDPRLRALPVRDLPAVPVHVSRRRSDRRGPVLALHQVVARVASQGTAADSRTLATQM